MFKQIISPVTHLGCTRGDVKIWCRRDDVIGKDGGWRGGRGRLGGRGYRLHWAVRYQTAGALWERGRQIVRQTQRVHHSSPSSVSDWECIFSSNSFVFCTAIILKILFLETHWMNVWQVNFNFKVHLLCCKELSTTACLQVGFSLWQTHLKRGRYVFGNVCTLFCRFPTWFCCQGKFILLN